MTLVVASPGCQPSAPVPAAAAAAGVPVWGDVELAWRLDDPAGTGRPRRWLVVTGTNGKTTTTSMLHAMLAAAGLRSLLCGNIGSPVLDVLGRTVGPAGRGTVELSAVLVVVAAARGGRGAQRRRGSPGLARVVRALRRRQGARAGRAGWRWPDWTTRSRRPLLDTAGAPVRVGFRLSAPAAGELGVRDAMLVDRRVRRRSGTGTGRVDRGGGAGRGARRTGRGGAGPGGRRTRRGDRGRLWRTSGWAGTAPRWWRSPTG